MIKEPCVGKTFTAKTREKTGTRQKPIQEILEMMNEKRVFAALTPTLF